MTVGLPNAASVAEVVAFLEARRDELIDREAESRAAGIQEALDAVAHLDPTLTPRRQRHTAVEPDPELMTTRDVAVFAQVTTRTVANWVAEGRLQPSFRTAGGHSRFRRAEVEIALQARTATLDGP